MATLKMKCSITGILRRMFDKRFTRPQLRTSYEFILDEFVQNFETARKAHEQGDMETVKEFFEIYC